MSKKKFNDKKVSKYVLRRDYSKIEKNFDEDYALKYIIDNMKKYSNDMSNPNMLIFKYEKS